MSEQYKAVVERYIDVWNLPDDRRRAEIDELFCADVVYIDPNVTVTGRDALERYIALTRRRLSRLPFSVRGDVDGHHDQARFAWRCGLPDAPAAASGFDVVLLDAGRVKALYGFFD